MILLKFSKPASGEVPARRRKVAAGPRRLAQSRQARGRMAERGAAGICRGAAA